MIVWGGYNGNALNDGGQYDPVANAWAATTTAGAPSGRDSHTAVWTGSRMIVWGGSTAALPERRRPVRPGRERLDGDDDRARRRDVSPHGGLDRLEDDRLGRVGCAPYLNDGGQYDPVANIWPATTATGAPSVRYLPHGGLDRLQDDRLGRGGNGAT